MRVVLFDLDHTLSNSTWRDALLPPNGTWDEYHSELPNDRPHENVCELVRDLHSLGYAAIGITVRPEKWRVATMAWCVRHRVPLSWLLMREANDFAPAAETKLALIEKHFTESQRRDIAFYIDDREDCCVAITEKFGITSLETRHRILS